MKYACLILMCVLISALMGCAKMEIAVFETNKGTIEIGLDRENAPITVENFVNYVEAGHYDGTIFHRVISDFMIQGGGFTADGNQKSTEAPIKLESQNGLSNDRGTVAMARTVVEDSATSQFFINVVDNDFLNYAPGNPGYAVFGRVVKGMDVVDKIGAVKVDSGQKPVKDVKIISVHRKTSS